MQDFSGNEAKTAGLPAKKFPPIKDECALMTGKNAVIFCFAYFSRFGKHYLRTQIQEERI